MFNMIKIKLGLTRSQNKHEVWDTLEKILTILKVYANFHEWTNLQTVLSFHRNAKWFNDGNLCTLNSLEGTGEMKY